MAHYIRDSVMEAALKCQHVRLVVYPLHCSIVATSAASIAVATG